MIDEKVMKILHFDCLSRVILRNLENLYNRHNDSESYISHFCYTYSFIAYLTAKYTSKHAEYIYNVIPLNDINENEIYNEYLNFVIDDINKS